jgi:hypothetical protein
MLVGFHIIRIEQKCKAGSVETRLFGLLTTARSTDVENDFAGICQSRPKRINGFAVDFYCRLKIYILAIMGRIHVVSPFMDLLHWNEHCSGPLFVSFKRNIHERLPQHCAGVL